MDITPVLNKGICGWGHSGFTRHDPGCAGVSRSIHAARSDRRTRAVGPVARKPALTQLRSCLSGQRELNGVREAPTQPQPHMPF